MHSQQIDHRIDELLNRLSSLEQRLSQLVAQRTVKDWYTVAEVAEILGKAEFTVREWCRPGRIAAAETRLSGSSLTTS